ncbi:MAG TPA: hypothetical protein VFD73_24330 [Gemmatimonadales bacterium]|nr:hypothetical protein [Gemmatimonadales bacterium]
MGIPHLRFNSIGHCSRVGSDMMKHVAPLGWEHLSLTGDCAWDTTDLPGPGELRLLRNKPSLLAARLAFVSVLICRT